MIIAMKRVATNILFWFAMAVLSFGLFTLVRGTPSARILLTIAGVLACTTARIAWFYWKRVERT